jgi:hypothetical protein
MKRLVHNKNVLGLRDSVWWASLQSSLKKGSYATVELLLHARADKTILNGCWRFHCEVTVRFVNMNLSQVLCIPRREATAGEKNEHHHARISLRPKNKTVWKLCEICRHASPTMYFPPNLTNPNVSKECMSVSTHLGCVLIILCVRCIVEYNKVNWQSHNFKQVLLMGCQD